MNLRDRDKIAFEIKKEVKPKVILKSEKKVESDNFESLLEIKGIGEETLEDIRRLYKNQSELVEALKEDKVPLRNDVVKKLKKKLL